MTFECKKCSELEARVTQLKADVLEIEDRRSRERTRFLNLQQVQFLRSVSPSDDDSVPKQDFLDLLQLLQRTVKDPHGEELLNVKVQLQKYLV